MHSATQALIRNLKTAGYVAFALTFCALVVAQVVCFAQAVL